MNLNLKIYLEAHLAWFIGTIVQNQIHKHHALQISIALEDDVMITTPLDSFLTKSALLVSSSVPHQLNCHGQHLTLLVNPTTPQGKYWLQWSTDDVVELPEEVITYFKIRGKEILESQPPGSLVELTREIKDRIGNQDSLLDPRIEKAIDFLSLNAHRVVSLEEAAAHSNLSESRFIHLFREQTGQTFRRAQLWNKVSNAVSRFGTSSLTEIAHDSGFSDSAHFGRTFKENFGFSPKLLEKNSQFIQVLTE